MAIEITKKDRILLINQYRILASLNPTESDRYEELIEVLERGYKVFYSMVDDWVSEDVPVEKSILVFDILNIYRWVEDFKRGNLSQAILQHPFTIFRGFDGNEESEYLGFARFLIGQQGKFAEQKQYLKNNDNLNSHFPMIEKYRKMIARWKEMNSPYQMNEQQIISILDA
jgi:uncharacterized protein YfbU (UPF0304 family)